MVLTFDFDGTIVDSMDHLADIAAKQIYNFYGLAYDMGRHLYQLTSGIPFEQQIELIFPGKEKNQIVVRNFEKIKKESVLDEQLFPEVKNIFSNLRKMGFKLVISSNNFQQIVDEYIKHAGVEVDLVLGYKKGFAKGEQHFNFIKDYFDVKSDEIIFIGDSIKDYERAKKNNIRFIGRTGTFSKKDFNAVGVDVVIDSLDDLMAILKI